MFRYMVELQRLYVRERSGRSEPRYVRNCRVSSDIDEDLITREQARPAAVVQMHFEHLRRHEMPCSHDQFRATRLIFLQSRGD
jgi:hypothetical protein